MDSAQTGVNVNLEALRLADERLAAGTGTQLDVLNAQQQLTTARSNLVSAEFSYISAVASYQQSTATETRYNDMFDDPLLHPSTLTAAEAAKAARARYDSPPAVNRPNVGGVDVSGVHSKSLCVAKRSLLTSPAL